MTGKLKVLCAAAIGLVLMADTVLAHHAFSAEFDMNNPLKVTGQIKKVEWQNPHVWFYVEAKNEKGQSVVWGFSGGPPGVLMRRGVTKERLKIGETVVVEGFRAKDGSYNGTGSKVTFADGRQVFAGANAEEGQR